jgi:hypothetical protein
MTAAAGRVSTLHRNARYDVAERLIAYLFQRRLADDRILGAIGAAVILVHTHWGDWQGRAREGLLLLASIAADLDRAEYRRIAEGLEEDYVHLDSWYDVLDRLVDEQRTLDRLSDGDRSAARAAEVADVRAHRDEALAALLTPAGAR